MRKVEKLIQKLIRSYNKGHVLKSKLYTYIIRIIFSCDITYTTKIDPTVQFIHNGLGCVIHPYAVIKEGCKIYQNVTLGGNSKIINGENVNTGGPILEQNVTVFSGACVLGPITIGQGSIVGANAVVLKDVPPFSLAVGVPAVIKPLKSEYNFNV